MAPCQEGSMGTAPGQCSCHGADYHLRTALAVRARAPSCETGLNLQLTPSNAPVGRMERGWHRPAGTSATLAKRQPLPEQLGVSSQGLPALPPGWEHAQAVGSVPPPPPLLFPAQCQPQFAGLCPRPRDASWHHGGALAALPHCNRSARHVWDQGCRLQGRSPRSCWGTPRLPPLVSVHGYSPVSASPSPRTCSRWGRSGGHSAPGSGLPFQKF